MVSLVRTEACWDVVSTSQTQQGELSFLIMLCICIKNKAFIQNNVDNYWYVCFQHKDGTGEVITGSLNTKVLHTVKHDYNKP